MIDIKIGKKIMVINGKHEIGIMSMIRGIYKYQR
jgi:hypothetical protein